MTISDSTIEQYTPSAQAPLAGMHICMHLMHTARTDTRIMSYATALKDAGATVSIVDIEAERTRAAQEEIQGVYFTHILMPSWFISTRFKPWFLVKLAHMIVLSIWKLWHIQADVYHARFDKALLACYLTARLRGKRLVFDAPDLPLDDPTVRRWQTLYRMAHALFSAMLPSCSGIIATSPLSAEAMRQRYHVSEVAVILNVPLYRQVARTKRIREALQLHPDTQIALYQGNIQPSRRLDLLVRAAPFLAPGIVIVLMGRDYNDEKARLERLITAEGVQDRVIFLPAVPPAELLEWTASADIGLTIFSPDYSTNIRMCLPNKLFEYLMAGLPVLSSQVDGIADILTTHHVGQVAPSLEPAKLADAINTMLADATTLSQMKERALRLAREELHWEKESQKLVHFYQRMLIAPASQAKTPLPLYQESQEVTRS